MNWFHGDCARLDEILVTYAKMGDAKLVKSVLGFEALSKEECLGLWASPQPGPSRLWLPFFLLLM